MSTSLVDLNFTTAGDNEIYDAIEKFIDISAPQADRQAEGYTVDFKEDWGDKSLRVVASFANTFGGIIVVGVSELSGRANEIVGIATRAELKTKIAGSISANISPIPSYDIAECGLPSDSGKRLAVIRVRADNRLHYLLKKGEQPIYVRNVDQSIPALAAELRALIENERINSTLADHEVGPFAEDPAAFRVTRAKGAGTRQERLRDRTEASSHLRVAIRPLTPLRFSLDYNFEEAFKKRVAKWFEEYLEAVIENISSESDSRTSRSYIYKILRDGADVESLWSVNAKATLGFACTLAITTNRPTWSLPDVAANLISCIRMADEMLTSTGYYGEIAMEVEMQPGGAVIGRIGSDGFEVFLRKTVYQAAWPIVIPGYQERSLHTVSRASATLDFNQRSGDLDGVVTQLLNELLRDLGYAADSASLKGAVATRRR